MYQLENVLAGNILIFENTSNRLALLNQWQELSQKIQLSFLFKQFSIVTSQGYTA